MDLDKGTVDVSWEWLDHGPSRNGAPGSLSPLESIYQRSPFDSPLTGEPIFCLDIDGLYRHGL